MTHGLNGDPPRIDDDAGEPAGAEQDTAALRTQLAATHARYRRAMHDAQRAGDRATRRTAFAEARRLAAHASRLQSRIDNS